MRWILAFPIDCDNPPAAAVVQKLDAVNSSSKRFLSLSVPRLVSAPDVGEVVPGLNAVGYRRLIKTFFIEKALCPLRILIWREIVCADLAGFVATARNKSCSGVKQRAKAVPVARSGRT